MALRPQDVVVVLKFAASGSKAFTYAQLGEELLMSPSQVFRSVERAEVARLLDPSLLDSYSLRIASARAKAEELLDRISSAEVNLPSRVQNPPMSRPIRSNVKEFLIHGVKYSFPVTRGGLVRGIPTAHAAAPLDKEIAQAFEPPPVWPDAEGNVRGTAFSPLYKNVPAATRRDAKLYELLALVDAIRDGRTREREIAIRELTTRIDAT